VIQIVIQVHEVHFNEELKYYNIKKRMCYVHAMCFIRIQRRANNQGKFSVLPDINMVNLMCLSL